MKLNWDDMRFFLVLCRTQSFVAAGNELKVTHSTVSRRLSAMEASLQTQLFTRTEKGCRLTPAGEKLLPYAEQLEATFIRLEEDVSGRNNQLSGSVQLAHRMVGQCFLASRLENCRACIRRWKSNSLPYRCITALQGGNLIFQLPVRKPTAGNIIVRKLSSYKLGLFATKKYMEGHPPIQSRDDLRSHRSIGYIDDLFYDQDLNFINEFYKGGRAQFRSSTLVGQKYAILADNGIGVIPYFMAHFEPTLVAVLPNLSAERTFWLQVNPDSRTNCSGAGHDRLHC